MMILPLKRTLECVLEIGEVEELRIAGRVSRGLRTWS